MPDRHEENSTLSLDSLSKRAICTSHKVDFNRLLDKVEPCDIEGVQQANWGIDQVCDTSRTSVTSATTINQCSQSQDDRCVLSRSVFQRSCKQSKIVVDPFCAHWTMAAITDCYLFRLSVNDMQTFHLFPLASCKFLYTTLFKRPDLLIRRDKNLSLPGLY